MQPDLFAADINPVLDRLRESGGLRDLDVAVARFLLEQQPDLDPAVALIAALTSAQLAAGHLCLDLSEPGLAERLWPDASSPAKSLAAELLPDNPRHWRALLAASPIVDQPGTDSGAPLVLEGERLYLRRHWRLEGRVAQGIAARLACRHPLPEGLHQRLGALFTQNGDTLDWQQVACALAVRRGLTLITGGPGTGKTTTVVRLLGLLQSLAFDQGKRLRIRLAAPTGKAAARLTDAIGEQVARLPVDEAVRQAIPTEVTTLHRLLGTRRDSRHFRHHAHNPLHADLVVVDEASMIDLDMMASLLNALSPQTRLVLLGDKDQLASVEAGAVMGDLCQDAGSGGYDGDTLDYLRHCLGGPRQPNGSASVPAANTLTDGALADYAGTGGPLAQQTAMLRKNWRFQDSPGIGALAAAINTGDDAAVVATLAKPDSAVTRLKIGPPPDQRLRTLLLDGEDGLRELFEAAGHAPTNPSELDHWARDCLQRLGRRQLLSGLRNGPFGVERLNRDITDWLRQADLAGEREWYAGRPVMLVRNDYQLGLMNGDVGLTLPHPDGLRVAFPIPGARIRWVLPSRLEGVETVYAMTVHKSQGSEFRHTLLILPDHPHPLLTRELIYTAVTRAREAFTLIEAGNSTVLKRAVRQRTWRASGLGDKLRT